jgi:hypothetical protein
LTLEEIKQEKLSSNFLIMLSQRPHKTLDNYVLTQKDTDIKILISTELLITLWLKAEILQIITGLEVNQFMELNSTTKILK